MNKLKKIINVVNEKFYVICLLWQIAAIIIIFIPGAAMSFGSNYSWSIMEIQEGEMTGVLVVNIMVIIVSMIFSITNLRSKDEEKSRLLEYISMAVPFIFFAVICMNMLSAGNIISFSLTGIIAAAVILGLIIIPILDIMGMKALLEAEEARKYAENKRITAEKRKAEEEAKALEFYNACKKRNLTPDFSDSENARNIMMIASTLGITGSKTAKRMYDLGAEVFDRKNLEKIKAIYADEKGEYLKALKVSTLSPKEKYECFPSNFESEINTLGTLAVVTQINDALATDLRHVDKSPTAAFIAGDIIGGKVLGAVAAAETMAENERGRALDEQNRMQRITDSANARRKVSGYNQRKANLESKKNAIEQAVKSLVVDESNMSEKFKLLSFSNWNFEITDGRNIRAKAFVSIDSSKVQLFNKQALIDGSLKLEILDSSNKVVATGCYTRYASAGLQGFREDGFPIHISVTCIADNINTVKETEKYTCRVTPIKMWFAEKIDDSVYKSLDVSAL